MVESERFHSFGVRSSGSARSQAGRAKSATDRMRKRVIIEAHNKAAVGAFGFLRLGTVVAIGLLAASSLRAGSR